MGSIRSSTPISSEGIRLDFLRIFIGKSMRKIEHLLPKDNRKNAKKKKIEELVDDLLLHVYHTLGGEEESEFDWKKFIKDSPEIEGLIEKNTDLIEAGMKRKQSKK